MAKRFLKGIALGGLLGGLAVWMHTTPKGKQTKEQLDAKLKDVWKKVEKEYAAVNPDGLKGLQKNLKAAARSWQHKDVPGEAKKALGAFLRKLK